MTDATTTSLLEELARRGGGPTPQDVAILDASGRVRATYALWEKHLGNLVRLPSVAKSYGNLTVHVMDKGSGKNAWLKNGEALAQEVAQLIDGKPEEPWLVVYHKGVKNGAIPDQIIVTPRPEAPYGCYLMSSVDAKDALGLLREALGHSARNPL